MYTNGTRTKPKNINPNSQNTQRAVVDIDALNNIGEQLLIALGLDTSADGLRDTPKRFANFWREFIEYDEGKTEALFETTSVGQLVIVKGIRVYSVCEHHLLPFWTDITIGYISSSKILGLSKFARIAQKHAHKPQVQEQLIADIKQEIATVVNSDSVIVYGKGVHLCMVMRGIKTPAEMVTLSTITGDFMHDDKMLKVFLTIAES